MILNPLEGPAEKTLKCSSIASTPKRFRNSLAGFLSTLALALVTRKCSYRPRNPEKFKDAKKCLKSDFLGSGQSDSEVA